MELLAPAGNLEKLKVAVSYGADAVYLAGQSFGLRAAADNFTNWELMEAVQFVHTKNCKVYVVLNSFLFEQDLATLADFVTYLQNIEVDAIIASDLAVVKTVQAMSSLAIHLSTQASCLNLNSALCWKDMGVSRVILGREASLKDAEIIKSRSGLEVEMFIHGSMCMAYSGQCIISNYTQGRDSNRGGCAHSCRFNYTLKNQEEVDSGFFMSSKDLNGLNLLKQYQEAGVDSIKVEGRMKGPLYVATVCSVYSQALKNLNENGEVNLQDLAKGQEELKKFSHRDYTQASLLSAAGEESIHNERHELKSEYEVLGSIIEVNQSFLILEVKNYFYPGDQIEILRFDGSLCTIKVDKIETLWQEQLEKAKPSSLVKLPFYSGVEVNNLVRIQR